MNRYPLWKNLLILGTILVSLVLALPNFFPQDPSIEVSAARKTEMTAASADEIRAALENAKVPFKRIDTLEGGKVLVRFDSSGDQLRGQEAIEGTLSAKYRSALTLSTDLPGWVKALGLKPMTLGLDLRGGVYVLIDVDMDAAVDQALDRYVEDIRTQLRDAKARYITVSRVQRQVMVKFADLPARDAGEKVIAKQFGDLKMEALEQGGDFLVTLAMTPTQQKQLQDFALQQNVTTLRNRVNALGVAEPNIARQGDRRIVVQLPGAQDPGRLKEILGATATLEYRLVDTEHSVADAEAGKVPAASRLYRDRDGRPVLLKRRVIVTGDQITDAASGFDSQSGTPMVTVALDGPGGRRMLDMTTENVGKPMAVVFIENRTTTKQVDGKPVKTTAKVEEVISVATIREPFGKRFQTTGLDSSEEAHNLALLLRAGALAAPIQIVEERTVGPSLGQDNIDQGLLSVAIGFLAVVVFMAFYYSWFGVVANVVLLLNLVLIVAVMALLGATLTMPGIAGMVLTIGMAVDANVLIFERMREEIRNGNTPQASIATGYDKALSSIIDANVTTLIAAVVLFSFGTGPIKGFAVTLTVGLIASMFTAITCSRAMINWIWGGRRLQHLPV
ncbi:MAG: protein translocase subunit SecD [Chromatiaceae bacterium]|nr:protein translocase subunit SecD [Chromatiaceae bacterium]MBP6582261.1 protein translocase subunit SecD [Chromatiaceae bacterium]MBP8290789.1 protein translocase subunit SecD [Chromatiaceae bacterium]MBP9603783.1 protein translocase subunit SecD [Chromatiaceae bacterium]